MHITIRNAFIVEDFLELNNYYQLPEGTKKAIFPLNPAATLTNRLF